ncbi:MAG TPA: adenylyltransferase/cytidyltransferase family protein, partial [Candidatus Ozemobacteraceae bacterium]|nr:adenylyltransferase/cytidyltransferase family protein [Candidatus Ozemobacteraceae bacterium]
MQRWVRVRRVLVLWLLVVATWVGAAEMPRRVGVFPGSFDPFHVGHLKVALEAASTLALDEVIIAPNATNIRKPGMSSLEFRWQAIHRALAELSDPRLSLLPIEAIENADRAGPPETAPQRLFEAAARSRSGAAIYQILGSDSFVKIVENRGLPKPGDHRFLIISMRPGEPLAYPSEVKRLQKLGLMHCIPEPNLDISSTRIRRAAREADYDFLRGHLPVGTWRLVMKHGAYGLDAAPGWPQALLELGPDRGTVEDHPEELAEGWVKDYPLPDQATASDGFPLEFPDARVQAIDFTASHTLGDLRGYLEQRLTPLGMKLIERPDVEVYLVRGPRERVGRFLRRLEVTRALEVTRSRSYITLGVVFGKRADGRVVVAIGDVWGRDRDLHTQALIGGALAVSGRPALGFRVVAYPAGADDARYMRDEYRRALQAIVPGTIDTAIVGYHWKVVQQLNWRLSTYRKFPNRWTMRDGRISTTWRYRIEKNTPETLPEEGWSRRYFDHRSLPFSLLFYRDSAGRPRTILLTRNVYGDQLTALLGVLVEDKKIRNIRLLGSCGGLNEELRVGDLVQPTETACDESTWSPAHVQPWS